MLPMTHSTERGIPGIQADPVVLQWLSVLAVHKDHLELLQKCQCSSLTRRDSDLIGLGWIQAEVFVVLKFPGKLEWTVSADSHSSEPYTITQALWISGNIS